MNHVVVFLLLVHGAASAQLPNFQQMTLEERTTYMARMRTAAPDALPPPEIEIGASSSDIRLRKRIDVATGR